MDISETDLPGVGKRFELPVHDGSSIIVVVHNTGQREVFRKENGDADAERVFRLNDEESQALGSILEDVHFQPAKTDMSSTMIGGDTVIEWYTLDENSPLIGVTLEESDLRNKIGVTVIAVERGPDAYPSPAPDFEFQAEDTLVVIGHSDEQAQLEALLSE